MVPNRDGGWPGFLYTRESSTAMTASGIGHAAERLQAPIHGAPGTATTQPAICCCRWTFSLRQTWKNFTRSRRRSWARRRMPFRTLSRTAIARGRSMPCCSIPRYTRPIWRWCMNSWAMGLCGEGRQANAGDGAADGADTVRAVVSGQWTVDSFSARSIGA